VQLFEAPFLTPALLAAIDTWPTGDVVRLVVVVLDLAAILSVVTGHGSVLRKLGWTAAILLLPLLGMVLYFVCGRSSKDS